MTAAKRKISVTLDADLVAEMGTVDEALSKQINDAVREAVTRRRRQRLLTELLADLSERHGAVSKTLIAKYEGLLE